MDQQEGNKIELRLIRARALWRQKDLLWNDDHQSSTYEQTHPKRGSHLESFSWRETSRK